MATVTWTGATDGDWAKTGNWAGGAVPVGDDDVVIDGVVDITAGLNQSAVNLKSLKILSTYSGNIGSGASALQINVTSTTGGNVPTCDISGIGSFYNLNGNFTTLNINTGVGSRTSISGGTTTTCFAGSGQYEFASGAVLTNLYNTGATGTLYYNATGVTFLDNVLGSVTSSRAATTWHTMAASKLLASATVTTARLFNGATFNDQSTGTITTLEVGPYSTYTPAGLKGSKTVTTCYQHPMSNLVETAPGATLTITTRIRTSQNMSSNQFFDV